MVPRFVLSCSRRGMRVVSVRDIDPRVILVFRYTV